MSGKKKRASAVQPGEKGGQENGQRAGLGTEAVEIGAQGLVGEVLLPQSGREQLDLGSVSVQLVGCVNSL